MSTDRLALLSFLLVLTGLGQVGCATGRGAASSLSFLKGRRVLVVAEGGAEASPGSREAETIRALALVPMRVHPSPADADLRRELTGEATRLELARVAAEERRIPWLLVRGERGARVENARGGEVRWELKLRGPGGDEDRRLAEALDGALRRPDDKDSERREADEAAAEPGGDDEPIRLDPRRVRLLDATRLAELRLMIVERRWAEHRAALPGLLQEFAADPALRAHAALLDALEGDDAGLGPAAAMNPHGERELAAVALLSEARQDAALTLLLREALGRTEPDRIDYRPALADAVAAVRGPAAAVAVCRGGFGGVDREAIESVAAGTAPHDAPDALPYADLRFHLGWYLAGAGKPQPAALQYETAADLYDKLGRPKEWGEALNNAGVALVEAERAGLAVSVLRRALKQRRKEGDPGRLALTRYNLARALGDSGRPDDALDEYRKAAHEFGVAGRPRDAMDTRIESLAMYAAKGDRGALGAESEALLEELVGESPEQVALRSDVWFQLGQGLMRFEEHSAAVDAFRRSAEGYSSVDRPLDEAQARYSMATPHVALFRFEDALLDLEVALRLAVELNDTSSVVVIRNQIDRVQGLIEMRTGRPPAARRPPPPAP